MLPLLLGFTAFNLCVAAACLGHGARMLKREERAVWRSKALLVIAVFLSWTFPLAALAASYFGWAHYNAGQMDAVPIVLLPIGWLLLLGVIFAIVDFAEDGRLDFGRGAP
ncbi:MAG: hypothetical protein AB7J28_11865 [Hyphomonadaceae bacterium]